MNVTERLKFYFKDHAPQLDAETIDTIIAAAEYRKLARKERILEQGNVCRFKVFVLNGLLRTYSIGTDGEEYHMRFTAEDHWMTDPESYNEETPSRLNVEALEPSEVLLWMKPDFEQLRGEIPGLKAFSERMVSKSSAEAQKRVLLNISATPEERYSQFEIAHSDILQRIPLHMIASYLGVSRKTLTRVRQERVVSGRS